MKKVLSLVLVIAMVLSSMSFAFAGTFEDVADTDNYAKAIETLTALGVVTGYEDGTYKPERTVTRAEMAKLLVEVLGYGDLVAGSKSNFSDTQGHWADSWIALAAGRGIVIGTGDGKFTPDRTVSYDEAITMVVRGLGYTDASNEIKSMTWPTNYKVKAAELELLDGVKMAATGADRGGVAKLLFNALEAKIVTVNSDGDVVESDNELLSRLAKYDSAYAVYVDRLDADSKKYGGNIVDLEPYMYQTIKAYVSKSDNDVVVYVKDTTSLVVSGTVADVLDKNGKSLADDEAGFAIAEGDTVKVVVEDANGKETKVSVKDAIKTLYNGEEETLQVEDFANLLYNKGVATITVVIEDKDEDGIIDTNELAEAAVAQKATKGILVDSNYNGKTRIVGKNANITLPTDDGKADLANIKVTGAVDSLDDIKADDVVIAYEAISGDTVKLVVVRDAVEGSVTKTNSSSTTVYIDGVSYSTSKITNSVRYGEKIVVGDKGTFFLDNAGKIFAVDTDGEELTDYALVLSYAEGKYSDRLDGSVSTYPQIKLLTQDGSKVTYKVLVSVEKDDDNKVVFDDVAIYSNNTVTDKDFLKLGATPNVDNNIQFVPTLTGNPLVKYSVDADGNIDEIEFVTTSAERIDLDDINTIASDDVIVFNTLDKEVADVNNLVDNAVHNVVYKSGKIVVIVTNNIESANDGVFGLISGTSYVKNNNGDTVVEVTALVDGEKVTYLTKKGMSVGSNGVSRATTASAFKFNFNTNDELTSVTAIVDADEDTLTIVGKPSAVSTTKITIGEDTRYFAGNCVVYIYDESADTWTIGDVSDLDEGYATTAYVLDTTSTSRVGLVVQVQP